MDYFTQHWHVSHASALQTEWTTLALWGNISIEDLAWEILGVDVEESPLPRAVAALPTIPRVTPDKRGGHNPRIYGSPGFVHRPAVPYHRALAPSYPPPSHLLPSLSSPQEDFTHSSSTSQLGLLAVNKSLKTSTSSSSHAQSTSVSLKAAPSARTKVPLPSSTASSSIPSAPAPKDNAQTSEDDGYVLKPAEAQQNGSRFQDAKPGPGFTLMGWQNPIMFWSSRVQTQIRNFTFPSPSIREYSHARETSHNENCKPSSFTHLAAEDGGAQSYLFAIKCVASLSLTSRSSLNVKNQEKSLAMNLVAERDLRDEFFTLKSFCYPDSLLPYITSVLGHCKTSHQSRGAHGSQLNLSFGTNMD